MTLRERTARAIAAIDSAYVEWENLSLVYRTHYLDLADAAIQVLRRDLVPEPQQLGMDT